MPETSPGAAPEFQSKLLPHLPRAIPLEGVIGYPITPFTTDGAVDLEKYRRLLGRLVDSGVHAVAPLGSTGVLPYLSDAEREAIVEVTMEGVAGKVPVMIGVSALTTERTMHHARFAERHGATAVMIIPMSYWKLTEREVFHHFKHVAESISIPIMAYNNPSTGGLDMTPEFLALLVEISNISMIKESTGDLSRLRRLGDLLAGADAAFFNGYNPLALEAFRAGAAGWCTAAPNLIPQLTLDLYAAARRGDWAEASALFEKQAPLLELIVKGGLPRTILAGLKSLGLDAGSLRAPLLELSKADTEKLDALLRPLIAN
jgi:4-hydroxy-tetrahydrodipicolinate synthase